MIFFFIARLQTNVSGHNIRFVWSFWDNETEGWMFRGAIKV